MLKSHALQSKYLLVAGAVVIIGLLVWGVGAYMSSKEKVLAQAFENLLNSETFHTTTDLTIRLPRRMGSVDRPFTEIQFRVEGDVQQATDSTPELAGQLRVEARGRGNVFFANGDVRILKDEVLFNLENLPVFLDSRGRLIKKWTRVETSLLSSANGENIKTALASAGSAVRYTGRDTLNEERVLRYHGALSVEEEEALLSVIGKRTSGNRALGIVERLLRANNVDALDIWVDSSANEIRRVMVHFARPLANGSTFDFATLTMDFSNYGQPVVIDRPEAKGRVRPEVFGRIFGSGEAEELQSE